MKANTYTNKRITNTHIKMSQSKNKRMKELKMTEQKNNKYIYTTIKGTSTNQRNTRKILHEWQTHT